MDALSVLAHYPAWATNHGGRLCLYFPNSHFYGRSVFVLIVYRHSSLSCVWYEYGLCSRSSRGSPLSFVNRPFFWRKSSIPDRIYRGNTALCQPRSTVRNQQWCQDQLHGRAPVSSPRCYTCCRYCRGKHQCCVESMGVEYRCLVLACTGSCYPTLSETLHSWTCRTLHRIFGSFSLLGPDECPLPGL